MFHPDAALMHDRFDKFCEQRGKRKSSPSFARAPAAQDDLALALSDAQRRIESYLHRMTRPRANINVRKSRRDSSVSYVHR